MQSPRHAVSPTQPSFPTRRSSDLAGITSRCSRRAPVSSAPICFSRSVSRRAPRARSSTWCCRKTSCCSRAPGNRRTSRADRKSTRLNSSHGYNSYPVFCLKKIKVCLYAVAKTRCVPDATLLPYTTLFRSRRDNLPMLAPGACELRADLFQQVGVAAGAARAQFYLVLPEDVMLQPGSRQSENIAGRSEEHTSELQSRLQLVSRLLLEKN